MKIAVAAMGEGLEAAADPRFGRCAFFVVVDVDSMQVQDIPNTAAAQGSGAGIAAARLVADAGADAVVAGNLGPNAHQALSAGGLALYSFAGGTVRQAVEAFKAGTLVELDAANVAAHFGMGGGGGQGGVGGMGGGGGRGMGGGMGRGMGGGRVMGMGRGMGGGVQAGDVQRQIDGLRGGPGRGGRS